CCSNSSAAPKETASGRLCGSTRNRSQPSASGTTTSFGPKLPVAGRWWCSAAASTSASWTNSERLAIPLPVIRGTSSLSPSPLRRPLLFLRPLEHPQYLHIAPAARLPHGPRSRACANLVAVQPLGDH